MHTYNCIYTNMYVTYLIVTTILTLLQIYLKYVNNS